MLFGGLFDLHHLIAMHGNVDENDAWDGGNNLLQVFSAPMNQVLNISWNKDTPAISMNNKKCRLFKLIYLNKCAIKYFYFFAKIKKTYRNTPTSLLEHVRNLGFEGKVVCFLMKQDGKKEHSLSCVIVFPTNCHQRRGMFSPKAKFLTCS